jgi:hypothetical protein
MPGAWLPPNVSLVVRALTLSDCGHARIHRRVPVLARGDDTNPPPICLH